MASHARLKGLTEELPGGNDGVWVIIPKPSLYLLAYDFFLLNLGTSRDTYSEANDGNPEDHQYKVTLFSAVLAPDTSTTTMVQIDQATALRQMGVILTNEVYAGVCIPDEHNEQEEMNRPWKRFLNKLEVRLAGLVVKEILAVGTHLTVLSQVHTDQVVSLLPSSIPSRPPNSSNSPTEAPTSASLIAMRSTFLYVELTFFVCRNSYGLIRTEIYMNSLIGSILDIQEQEKLQTG